MNRRISIPAVNLKERPVKGRSFKLVKVYKNKQDKLSKTGKTYNIY